MDAKTTFFLQPQRTPLLQLNGNGNSIVQTVLMAQKGSHFCINISNPYSSPLKYLVALLPRTITNKPNDYFTYFSYAKR